MRNVVKERSCLTTTAMKEETTTRDNISLC